MHLGYYIHHHGKGHLNRAKTLASKMDLPMTVMGSNVRLEDWSAIKDCNVLPLPDDSIVKNIPLNRDKGTSSLHYSPLYSRNICYRFRLIADWVDQVKPTAVIVDVSSEVTQFFRLLGVPVLSIRQHGDRTDNPHLIGYESAFKLLASYPEELEQDNVLDWIKAKTIYMPGFSRYSSHTLTKEMSRTSLGLPFDRKIVVVINGNGGDSINLPKVINKANKSKDWYWIVVGKIEPKEIIIPENVLVAGWVEDTFAYLKSADVIVASSGHNTVMEIGSARVPYIAIPETRPFDEQLNKALVLEKKGLCKVMVELPDKEDLEESLAQDVSLWSKIINASGVEQACSIIRSTVYFLEEYRLESNFTRPHTPALLD